MGIFDGLMKRFQNNWCKGCKAEMSTSAKQLYWMPMTVGHYVDHKDAGYYLKNLRPIMNKAQIPAGYYACDISVYRCPGCGKRITVAAPFLQVRNEEKTEISRIFENGELDSLPGLIQ